MEHKKFATGKILEYFLWGIEDILFCPSIDPRLFWPNTIFFGPIQIVSARSKIVLNNIELDKAFDNGHVILEKHLTCFSGGCYSCSYY